MGLGAFFLSMRAVRLDDETADRMLAGVIDPADAPPGFAAVTELLGTVRSAAGVPVPATVVARRPGDRGLADTASEHAARGTGRGRRVPVLAAVAFCAMTGGAYAAGVTGAGSSTVSAVLDRIGVGSLVGGPSGDRTAATSEAALKGEASAQTTTEAGAAASVGAGHRASHDDGGAGADGKGNGKGHGAEISTLARTTDAKGVDKGAEISTAASGGKSHAGEHGNGGRQGATQPIPRSRATRRTPPLRRIPAAGTGTAGARRSPAADGGYRVVNVPPARSRIRRAPSPARRRPSGTRAPCRAGWPRGTAARAPWGR